MSQIPFEECIRPHLKALYCYCLSRTCDPHQAEELAQETLVRAFEAYPRLKSSKAVYAWLVGIAKRCSWTWWWKAKRDPLRQVDQAWGPELNSSSILMDSTKEPLERVIQQELETLILVYIKKLPQIYREVILYRYYEDLSYAEIALRMGLSIEAVDQRLTRAKQKLRKQLFKAEVIL